MPGRPHVIVHMMSSIDGRIIPRNWSPFERGTDYEDIHAKLAGDAWMCGRVTMTGYTRGQPSDDADPTPVPRTDHIAKEAASYAVALDVSGRLHWGGRNDIEGDHLIVAIGEGVSDAHLNALRASGVSYLFCGRDRLDLPLLLGKLQERFGIARLLVEGGGGINGSFLEVGAIDEISLLLAPTVDGRRGTAAVFDFDPDGMAPPVTLTLDACEPLGGGTLWLRYRVQPRS